MKKWFAVIWLFLLPGHFFYTIESGSVSLERIDGVYGISSFLTNTKDEIFLFSRREGKIFKFKPQGEFEKSFCRFG